MSGHDAEFERAVALLEAAEVPALACHVHPDGDALGSLLAMHLLCESQGRRPVSSFPSPFSVAPHYRFLPGLDRLTPPGRFPADPDLLVTFDVGNVGRMGDLAPSIAAASEVLVLDHHDDNTRFGSVNVVQTDAAATAVVVRRLASALGWPLTRDAALNLYVGLLTDTGRFQYPNTTPDVFVLAEELAEFDLPLADLTRELFEKHRFAYVRLAGLALARAQLDEGNHLVAAWLTAEELREHGVGFDETEGFIDLLRRTAEAEVVVALKEAPSEGLRVSLRSLGGVDVGEVATALGGGGHPFMAGFTTQSSISETLERVRALVQPGTD
ncbi:MAG TPA: bifunctional oligoribonuclease/PAP phosphatase NrnA [Acidimicrobiales bacterium]|nr:bifunctional oligoribonuclease/PAP phosphatase NrnA [Acidimicrobiales bacterium]